MDPLQQGHLLRLTSADVRHVPFPNALDAWGKFVRRGVTVRDANVTSLFYLWHDTPNVKAPADEDVPVAGEDVPGEAAASEEVAGEVAEEVAAGEVAGEGAGAMAPVPAFTVVHVPTVGLLDKSLDLPQDYTTTQLVHCLRTLWWVRDSSVPLRAPHLLRPDAAARLAACSAFVAGMELVSSGGMALVFAASDTVVRKVSLKQELRDLAVERASANVRFARVLAVLYEDDDLVVFDQERGRELTTEWGFDFDAPAPVQVSLADRIAFTQAVFNSTGEVLWDTFAAQNYMRAPEGSGPHEFVFVDDGCSPYPVDAPEHWTSLVPVHLWPQGPVDTHAAFMAWLDSVRQALLPSADH
jgi:hypothetical protein